MDADRLAICAGCGVVAPSARTTCSQCQAALRGAPLVVTYSPKSLYCARALAEFRCGACTSWTPIDGIHVGDAIECNRCGLMQRWREQAWQELVAETRGIADLARSSLQGDTLNPYRDIGVERTSFLFQETIGEHSLRAWLTPGHPVCERCHVPLDLVAEGEQLRTRCPSCADAIRYAAPIPHPNPHSLRGALALAHRTDRPAARSIRRHVDPRDGFVGESPENFPTLWFLPRWRFRPAQHGRDPDASLIGAAGARRMRRVAARAMHHVRATLGAGGDDDSTFRSGARCSGPR